MKSNWEPYTCAPGVGRFIPHLGGGRSIQLSYGNIYKNKKIVELATFSLPSQGERWNTFLGGVCSIQLSYWDLCKKYELVFLI